MQWRVEGLGPVVGLAGQVGVSLRSRAEIHKKMFGQVDVGMWAG